MNQDEDNGVIPEKEERPNIDIKEEEVFTTEAPLDAKVEKTPKLLSCKVCFVKTFTANFLYFNNETFIILYIKQDV